MQISRGGISPHRTACLKQCQFSISVSPHQSTPPESVHISPNQSTPPEPAYISPLHLNLSTSVHTTRTSPMLRTASNRHFRDDFAQQHFDVGVGYCSKRHCLLRKALSGIYLLMTQKQRKEAAMPAATSRVHRDR